MAGSAAQAGFYYQNHVAAFKILDNLFFQSNISHIELENYQKGKHIDDVIVYRSDRVDYTQVKWSEDTDNSYTLNNLLTAEENKKSIFKQLAEGYLDAVKTGKPFTITLFTTKRKSNEKRPSKGLHHSLTEIIDNYIIPSRIAGVSYDQISTYATYQATIDKIKEETGLSAAEFTHFITTLEFQFSQPSIDELQQMVTLKMSSLGLEESLYDRLLNKIVEWSTKETTITKNVLLDGLGISDRFEDKLSHYFKVVDEQHYVANEELLNKIEDALTDLPGGYIFIEGLPGIGKSTALTKLKEQNKDIAFAYYCFIPDEKSFSDPRQSAQSFFRSMCVAIEKNFPDIDLPTKYSGDYKDKLPSYIKALSKHSTKTIFIVDGLDHVHRGIGFNDSSLLNELKGNIPDGVYFILSSQYLTALSHDAQVKVRSDEKRFIQVPRFGHREIKQYLENKGIKDTSLVASIEKVSGGIPLYLHYITELLLKSEAKDYDSILEELPNLTGDAINAYHQYLYNAIENNTPAKWVLATLAYRKEKTTTETLHQLLQLAGLEVTLTTVEDLVLQYSHLLKRHEGKSYSIFHNSFREFILEKSKDLRDRFNRALADYYEHHPYDDESYRNYFKHLAQLGEYSKIVSATNWQWARNAWAHYRSLDEIESNIAIAWKATVESEDLSSFIRVGFLKAQVHQLKHTIENTNIDFPILFLRAGLIGPSIRGIWDGDFLGTSDKGFVYYLTEYYDKTGLLLPDDILKQGLSKMPSRGGEEETLQACKVSSLIKNDVVELFDRIGDIQWTKSTSEEETEEELIPIPENENQEVNTRIRNGVVDFLLQRKQFEKLQQLHEAYQHEQSIGAYLKATLSLYLLPRDKATATDLIQSIDWTSLPPAIHRQLLNIGFSHLTLDEMKALFPTPPITSVELHDTLIDESESLSRTIRDEIPALFDEMKVLWTFNEGQAREVSLKISLLADDVQDIYYALYSLSESWYLYRKGEQPIDEVLQVCKEALDALSLERTLNKGKANFGIFDMPKNDYVIEANLHKLIRVVFDFAIEVLPDQQLAELAAHWMEKEHEETTFHPFSVPMAIAKVIQEKSIPSRQLIARLLHHAEKIARKNGDTGSLTDNLAQLALAYGGYGFLDDFRRLYEELPVVAFGLSYRKDYQASYIISALEAVHDADPSNTLSRLAEVFQIQKKLAGAGNGHMRHIVFSELIAFAMEHFPQLGFELLQTEERTIERSEGLSIALDPLIKRATAEELRLYLPIAKTLPRWTRDGDNHFLSLLQDLLKKAVILNDQPLIETILNEATYNADVELEDESLLKPFADTLKLHHHEDIIEKLGWQHLLPMSHISKKAIAFRKTLTADYLRPLFAADQAKFEAEVFNSYDCSVRAERSRLVSKEYTTWRKTFTDSVKTLQPGEGFHLIKMFARFKAAIVALPVVEPVRSASIEALFDEFIRDARDYLNNPEFEQLTESTRTRAYHPAGSLSHRVSALLDLITVNAISELEAFRFVETGSVLKARELVAFIDKWLIGEVGSIALLKLANRVARLYPNITQEILDRFTASDRDQLLFPSDENAEKLGCDIFETLLQVNPAMGKRLLLEYYVKRKGRYADELTANARRLLKYAPYFKQDDVSKAYYDANLEYNRHLAEGLPEITVDYSWVRHHREEKELRECVLEYLISQFHFPVFKVRELALQSTVDYLVENIDVLPRYIRITIVNGTNHTALYAVIVLRALVEKTSTALVPLKEDLLMLVSRSHFQLLEATKELLLRLEGLHPGFLTASQLSTVQYLNTPSPLLLTNSTVLTRERTGPFVYNDFLKNLLSQASTHASGRFDVKADVYNHLTRTKNIAIPSEDAELEIHRWYNSNTNVDTIEVYTAYDDELYDSINEVLHARVRSRSYETTAIEALKVHTRIYDASWLLFKTVKKPSYIKWLPNIAEADFDNFLDASALIKQFLERESDYITLGEFGVQRVGHNDHPVHRNIIQFHVLAYFQQRGQAHPAHVSSKWSQPLIQNRYAYELPLPGPTERPSKPREQLLDVSANHFRGIPDFMQASLTQSKAAVAGVTGNSLLDILTNRTIDRKLEAFRWQRAYTDSGWRRYKPTSEGFTFKICKSELQAMLETGGFDLWYHLFIRLAYDDFKPDRYLRWKQLHQHCKVELP
ncbi:MAG TPA: dsDNA nuclease domain-containing protein [Flavisolibacter sp.]|nr:dsDNA nuclease domain-containing protein [Flavisolibacter sp.]